MSQPRMRRLNAALAAAGLARLMNEARAGGGEPVLEIGAREAHPLRRRRRPTTRETCRATRRNAFRLWRKESAAGGVWLSWRHWQNSGYCLVDPAAVKAASRGPIGRLFDRAKEGIKAAARRHARLLRRSQTVTGSGRTHANRQVAK